MSENIQEKCMVEHVTGIIGRAPLRDINMEFERLRKYSPEFNGLIQRSPEMHAIYMHFRQAEILGGMKVTGFISMIEMLARHLENIKKHCETIASDKRPCMPPAELLTVSKIMGGIV